MFGYGPSPVPEESSQRIYTVESSELPLGGKGGRQMPWIILKGRGTTEDFRNKRVPLEEVEIVYGIERVRKRIKELAQHEGLEENDYINGAIF